MSFEPTLTHKCSTNLFGGWKARAMQQLFHANKKTEPANAPEKLVGRFLNGVSFASTAVMPRVLQIQSQMSCSCSAVLLLEIESTQPLTKSYFERMRF